MEKFNFLIFLLVTALVSCNNASLINSGKITIRGLGASPTVSQVTVKNNQLIVTGTNLHSVSQARIEGDLNHNFIIESKAENRLILNARSALALVAGGFFDLVISNAAGSASFPITLELQNGQVTAAKLHNMGATSGQVLRFNGTNWAPASIQSSLVYTGTYNATTDTPDIASLGGLAGNFYIVTTGGTQDLGSGPDTFAAGDWVIFDGTNWSKIPMSGNSVSSFNGRMGVVTPLANDYSWSMLSKTSGKLTGSKLSDISDVVVTGIQDGDTLSWDQSASQWVVGAPTAVIAAGSVTNTQLANGAVDGNKIAAGSVGTAKLASDAVDSSKILDGTIVNADISGTAAIAQSKIANLTTDLAAKEPTITAGTTAQYYRGDKSWQSLTTTAVPEGSNLYFADARVRATALTGYTTTTASALAATDNILQAFAKLEAQITAAAGSGVWSTTGTVAHYTAGNVGIGNTNAAQKLVVTGNAAVSSRMAIGQSTVDTSAYLHIKRDTGATGDDNLFLDNVEFGTNKFSSIMFATGGTGRARITGGSDAAGGVLTFSADTTTPTEHMRLLKDGSLGIGTVSPRATLDVRGTIVSKPAVSNATAVIDTSKGNVQYTSSNCGAFQFHHLKDGGSYMFVVKGTTAATCAFTGFSDAGSTALTVHLPPDHGATTAGKHTIYNMTVVGNDVYVAWTPGY